MTINNNGLNPDAPEADPDGGDLQSDFVELRRELLAPGMWWLALVLGGLACGLLAWWAASGGEPEIYFPFHLQGAAAWTMVGAAAALWAILAVGLWVWWLLPDGGEK